MATSSLADELRSLLSEEPAAAMVREHTAFDAITAPFGDRLVLFGAGQLGRKALHALRAHGVEPLAFADDAPSLRGKEVEGVKVLPPEQAARQFGDSATFVGAFFTPISSYLAVRDRLRQLSCAAVTPFIPLFWKYAEQCMPYVQLDLPHKILREKDQVQRAFDLLGDDISRREYLGQIKLRLHFDYEALPLPTAQEQYFPDDLFKLAPGEVYVDCGAFDGDTLRAVLRLQPSFGRIVALEPDPANFKRLKEFVGQLPSDVQSCISTRQSAVGATKQIVRFDADGTSASRISERGGVEVECNALDDLFADNSPTFVKMDVEGAELDALAGSRRLLCENRAIWAICVYHKSQDLWKVPLALAAHTKDYRFFLRKYVGEVWESVAYGVPASRVVEESRG